jgi:hypothetical protein
MDLMADRRKVIRRTLVVVGGLLVASTAAVIAAQPLWAFDLLAWAMPRILWRVDATFFLIGDRAVAHPDLVGRLRREGHEVGNHYLTIRSTIGASDEEFLANLMRTEEVLGLDGPLKLFRPPGGRIRPSQRRLAEERGYRVVLGSAYPYDGSRTPSAYIRWLVTKNLAPGVIVILHDGIADPSRMITVLDSILGAGERQGIRFVTVGALLQASNDEGRLQSFSSLPSRISDERATIQ